MITNEITKHTIEITDRTNILGLSKDGITVAKYKQLRITKKLSDRIIIFSVFISFLIYGINVQKRNSPVQSPLNVISLLF
jgi:hypothetical protein